MPESATGNKYLEWLKNNWVECLVAAVTAIAYCLLFDRYLPNDEDDTWYTAWVYYFFHDGQTRDMVFMEQFPEFWGVRFFSHLFCWVYGGILDLIGFTRPHVHLLSNLFIFAGLGLWYRTGKRIWKSGKRAFVPVLLLALSTLCLGAANKGRTDAFVFFLHAASLLLFVRKQYFSSVLVLCMAVETHPVGLLGGCYLAAYAIHFDRRLFRREGLKPLLRIAAGGIAGIGLYLLLHRAELSSLGDLCLGVDEPSNFLFTHFFGRGHLPWRYWPDILLFSAAAVWTAYRCWRDGKWPFPLTASLLLVGASFLLRRGNFHYALFCYPAFMMLAAEAFGQWTPKRVPLLLVLWAGLQLPQFFYLYHKNAPCRDYGLYMDFLSGAGFPSDALIYGQPADWFGLQQYRNFRSLTHFHPPQGGFYLIEHEGTRYQQPAARRFAGKGYLRPPMKSLRLPSGGEIRIQEVIPLPASGQADP